MTCQGKDAGPWLPLPLPRWTPTSFLDLVEFTSALTKSADQAVAEQALIELDRLNAIAAAGLVKVGPKGYIHGWIFVGAPGVGGRVFHPQHGHGTITRHGKATVGVRFDSGKEHAFEHAAHHGRATGPVADGAHFAERVDRRKGPRTPKAVAEVAKPERDVTQEQVKQDIRDAIGRVSTRTGNDWVGLADLRDELGGKHDRATVDRVLRQMGRGDSRDGVLLEEETNQKALTQRARDAAINIGARDQHVVRLSDTSPATGNA